MRGAKMLHVSLEGEPEAVVDELWKAYAAEAGPFINDGVEAMVKGIWMAAFSTGCNVVMAVAGQEDQAKVNRMLTRIKEEVAAYYAAQSTRVDDGETDEQEG